jgi:transcriptional regulator with XRE-family HTH domain
LESLLLKRKDSEPAARPKPKAASGRADVDPIEGPARIVKTLRQRAGLTLTELAERSGLAVSTLSKIESGQLLPGYDSILRLADGLQVEVAQLFISRLAETPTGRRGVTRKNKGARLHSPHYDYEALAADLSNKKFLPLLATINARSVDEFERLTAHAGEEFVFVLSGEVMLHTDAYEPLLLAEGDSVYFNSRSGHALVSVSEENARIVWITSDLDAMRISEA